MGREVDVRREDTEDGSELRVLLHSVSPVVVGLKKKHTPKVQLQESPDSDADLVLEMLFFPIEA